MDLDIEFFKWTAKFRVIIKHQQFQLKTYYKFFQINLKLNNDYDFNENIFILFIYAFIFKSI